MSWTTLCHNENNFNNDGLLRLESLQDPNEINNIIVSQTTRCHNDNNFNNDGSLK